MNEKKTEKDLPQQEEKRPLNVAAAAAERCRDISTS